MTMDDPAVALARVAATDLASRDYESVVVSLRAAFDDLSDEDYRALIDVQAAIATGVGDAASWSSVAEAVDEPVALYNLAVLLWSKAGLEERAVEAMRLAQTADAPSAGITLAEWLEWLGRPHEALAAIKEHVSRHGAGLREAGVTARIVSAIEVTPSDDTIRDLARASERYPEFLPSYWDALVAARRLSVAKLELERAAASGNADAALRLGNLLASDLGDKSGAELAYRRAVDLGDGHAAHNLALDLIATGRLREARAYLEIALDRGDADARETLATLE